MSDEAIFPFYNVGYCKGGGLTDFSNVEHIYLICASKTSVKDKCLKHHENQECHDMTYMTYKDRALKKQSQTLEISKFRIMKSSGKQNVRWPRLIGCEGQEMKAHKV